MTPLPTTQRRVAALLGNPNTGKTTLFNALSGLNHHVGNYPGVTVESKKGHMVCAGQPFDLIDLPGTYSLAPRSPDEMVAVDIILGQQQGEDRPDVVVCIVDASNLDRNLYLTTQALELGVPIVVALNMMDLAVSQGIHIDITALAERLGVPVVAIQANKKRGLAELRDVVAVAAGGALPSRRPTFPPAFDRETATLASAVGAELPTYLVRRLLLDVGGWTEKRLTEKISNVREQVTAARQRLQEAGCPVPAVEARSRYGWIREVTATCVQRPAQRPISWTDRLDRVLTHRLWGTLVFLLVMGLMFQAIFTWAKPLMKLIDTAKQWLGATVADLLPAGPFTSLLVDGAIAGVGSVVVFLPQILILFAFIALLEDCGYMARAAFLMDRLMSRCGLSGKSFIPLLSSLACAVPGIMATRVIEDRRDRLATMLVAPLMSCSARLPVYILLIGAFLTEGYPFWLPGVVMFCMYGIGLVTAPLMALLLKRTLLRGETPVFVMEMPAYKWPGLRTVFRRLYDSGWAFLRRAGTVILATTVVVWAALYFPTTSSDSAEPYPDRITALVKAIEKETEELQQVNEVLATEPADVTALEKRKEELIAQVQPVTEQTNELKALWKKHSYLGQLGQWIEPLVRPLGWDWRIGVATLASFPAREVVVGTLGIVYQQGEVDTEEIRTTAWANVAETDLGKAMRMATWDGEPHRRVFTVPTALSVLVFFALCCQCASTLAVIRRETRTWRWPVFTFVYMTGLAYIAAMVVFQVGTWLA